ncbi:30S ribosomal protein S6 [Waterburya agarophytonicola K14]|uniref:Small ribosomal subunit protein bS6 n=1 Tax=Waterburya agarophytonicola KI4 TaxID=2874699 RepID=A0A964BSR7_9CYAN|nr:30S ribosomal protein S6 [Waterburya agarophytonicola]MCC0179104.1 30S ribosomal protein S6 [Waterburya agarophytonicola KI4]
MSSSYEMMYILRPDLSEELVGEAVTKYQNFLTENGAENLEVQIKGKRRLAYSVGKYLDGIYVQVNYDADGSQIAPLERMMRLSEDTIRYLTIKLKKRAIIAAQNAAAQPIAEADD